MRQREGTVVEALCRRPLPGFHGRYRLVHRGRRLWTFGGCPRSPVLQVSEGIEGLAVQPQVVFMVRHGGGTGPGQNIRRLRQLQSQRRELCREHASPRTRVGRESVQTVSPLQGLDSRRMDTQSDRAVRGKFEADISGAVPELYRKRLEQNGISRGP